jgi:hypothetical protein
LQRKLVNLKALVRLVTATGKANNDLLGKSTKYTHGDLIDRLVAKRVTNFGF